MYFAGNKITNFIKKIDIMKTCKCYEFMAEIADRRTSKYKELEIELDTITKTFGKESFQVKRFFDRCIIY